MFFSINTENMLIKYAEIQIYSFWICFYTLVTMPSFILISKTLSIKV
jgi:hypothetical protein